MHPKSSVLFNPVSIAVGVNTGQPSTTTPTDRSWTSHDPVLTSQPDQRADHLRLPDRRAALCVWSPPRPSGAYAIFTEPCYY